MELQTKTPKLETVNSRLQYWMQAEIRELEPNTTYWVFSREQFEESCDRARDRIRERGYDPFKTREATIQILEKWKQKVLQKPGSEKYEIAYRSRDILSMLGLDGWIIVLECGLDPTIHPPPCNNPSGIIDYHAGILNISVLCVHHACKVSFPLYESDAVFDTSEDIMCAQMQYILDFKRDRAFNPRYIESLNSSLYMAISNERYKLGSLLIQYGACVNSTQCLRRLFEHSMRSFSPRVSDKRKMDFMLDNGFYFDRRLTICNHYGSYYYGVVSGAYDPNAKCTITKNKDVPNCIAKRRNIDTYTLDMFRLIKLGHFINTVCFPESIKERIDELQWALLVKQTNLPIPVEILVYRVICYL